MVCCILRSSLSINFWSLIFDRFIFNLYKGNIPVNDRKRVVDVIVVGLARGYQIWARMVSHVIDIVSISNEIG